MNKRYAFYGFLTGIFALLLMGAKITSNILQLGRGTAEDISIQFNTGTANQPLIKWDNAASVLKFSNNGTDFFNFGSGSGGGVGGLSYIENGDFEGLNVTGWGTYADAAAATPADGTGGTANITVSFNNVTPLNGDGQLRISKDAANRQGEGISYAFTVPQGYRQGRKAGISFVVDASTANYAAGDLAVYVYDVTNATLITPTVAAIPKAKTPIKIAWDQSTGTDFRLIFHITSTNATAYDVYLDDIVIGPEQVIQGSPISDSISVAVNTTNFPDTSPVMRYTRIGTRALIDFQSVATGAVTGNMSLEMPSGLTIDSSVLSTVNDIRPVGVCKALDNGTNRQTGVAVVISTTAIQCITDGATGPWSAADPMTWASTDTWEIQANVPIAEWANSATFVGQSNVEYAFNTDTTSTASVTSSGFGYGPDGQAFSANFALGTEYTRRVRYLTPVQGTDALDVEVFDSNNPVRWLPIEKVLGPYMRQGTSAYGIRVISVSGSTTDVDVIFSAQGFRASNATYAGNGDAFSAITNFKWRLKKTSGGNSVGFGFADASNSGLLSTAAQTISGQKTWNDAQTFKVSGGTLTAGSYSAPGSWLFGYAGLGARAATFINTDAAQNATMYAENRANPVSGVNQRILDLNFDNVTNPTGGFFIYFRDGDTSPMGSVTAASATTVAFNTSSDERLKENIKPMENGLLRVLQLYPSSFTWKEDGHADEGFIAQNVKKVYPSAVHGDESSDPKVDPMQVDYGKLTPLLAAAIKDLAEQNKQLQNEIEQLKRLIEEK